GDQAAVDRVLHRGDEELHAGGGDPLVAEGDDLVEVLPGVDVHDGEGDRRGRERLLRQVEHDEGVLAAREEQHWALTGRRDLTEDVDRLRLQRGEMADAVVAHRRNTPLSMTPSGSGSFSLMTRRA